MKGDLDHQKRNYEHICEEGKQVLDGLKPGREKDKLERKLQELETSWDELTSKVKDREEKLQEVEPTAQQHHNTAEVFTAWLTEAEQRLEQCEEMPSDEEELIRQMEVVEVGFELG